MCTIAATNDLARVRVLARSLAEQTTDTLAVFFIDDPEGVTADADESFRVLSLHDLALPSREFSTMAMCYSLIELATAVKPSVLAALLNGAGQSSGPADPVDVAVYLDPDTEAFAPLDDLWLRCAHKQAIMLTPHALEPYPRDHLTVAERKVLLSGVFNTGVVAVPNAPCGHDFLTWWAERLRTDALIDPGDGMFADQRWIDLAPTLFDCDIVRDPGVNVAYWNLHERPLSERDGRWFAGEAPLRLFHYSGFDPAHPHLVSVHQHATPRVVRSTSPALQKLLDRYSDLLDAAGIATESSQHGYRWDTLPNGIPMTTMLRRLYRSEFLDHERGTPGCHPLPPAPGDEHWVAAFTDWLCEPVPPRSLPRLVETLLAHRPDVAAAFMGGDPTTAARNLGHWLSTWGVDGHGLTASLAQKLWIQLDAWADASRIDSLRADRERTDGPIHSPSNDSNPPGDSNPAGVIDVLGFTSAVSGLSSAALQVAEALRLADADIRQVAVEHPDPRMRNVDGHAVTLFGSNPNHRPAATTIACFNPDLVEAMGPMSRNQLLGSGYRIGYWWWEVDLMPPEQLDAFTRVDEVWAGSTFVADALRGLGDTPVHRVPLPLRQPSPGALDPEVFDLAPHEHLFSFVFDNSSTMARKNPVGLIEAYCEAFTPADGCVLVVKSMNAQRHSADAELLRYLAGLRPDVHLIEQRIEARQVDSLIARSTAFISLHRSEGLGLSIADACQMGVPVIASAYGGCMDFLTADTSLLVPTTLVPVGAGSAPYPPEAMWADPDLEVAVGHLRHAANNPTTVQAMAKAAQTRVRATYDAPVCAAVIAERLQHINHDHSNGDSAESGVPLP